MAFHVSLRGVFSNLDRRCWMRAGSGSGSGLFWTKVPLSPPGWRPRAWNWEAAKEAAMCSSRVAEPRPWRSSAARKSMSAWTSRSRSWSCEPDAFWGDAESKEGAANREEAGASRSVARSVAKQQVGRRDKSGMSGIIEE